MNIKEFAKALDMDIITEKVEKTEKTEGIEEAALDGKNILMKEVLDKKITGIYVCDLLSWVMSHAKKGDAWITVQTHLNIVAVAVLLEISCIIIPEGIKVEEATIKKASEEGITILSSKMSAYEICWRAHEILC